MMFIAFPANAKTPITIRDTKGQPPPYNSGVPVVEFDGDDISIKSDSIICNAEIVIRDQFGKVMHFSNQTISQTGTTVTVPEEDGCSEKATIDIYYDNKHYNGNFYE